LHDLDAPSEVRKVSTLINKSEDPENIWIIGSGRYGDISAKGVRRRWPAARLTIVDHDPDVCAEMSASGDECVTMDGVTFLVQNLAIASRWPDWIIPVIPIHVSYEWIKAMLTDSHRFQQLYLPDEFVKSLPNAVRGGDGEIYLSNADFVCPETCSEPDRKCTVTREERPRIMHRFLQSLRFGEYHSHVVRSRQLCPGVGGFRPRDLFGALETVRDLDVPVLLSTACSCHGVMQAFSMQYK
jgi:hypothetical protein